jgi:crossover junction endodeoxyribonuclease RuvC
LIVLGIDPGSKNLGYGILEIKNRKIRLLEAGLIKTKTINLDEQILDLEAGLEDIFERFVIDEVAIESIFFAHNPKSIIKLAQIRGAVILKVLQKIGKFYEYSPLEVKRSAVGNGKASKEQVAFMMKKILNIKKEIKPFDISDALAVAFTHSQRKNLQLPKGS